METISKLLSKVVSKVPIFTPLEQLSISVYVRERYSVQVDECRQNLHIAFGRVQKANVKHFKTRVKASPTKGT